MAGICTSNTSPGGCNHRSVTINLDGTPHTIEVLDMDDPLTTAEKEQFLRLALRRAKAAGISLGASFLNRVCVGDEATNVKMYSFFGPGAAITKTNIGTSYVNIAPGANGERQAVDFTGCTQFRLIMHANLAGTGQWGARVVRDSDNEVLFESANLGAGGERELDSNWQDIPPAFAGSEMIYLRAQAKSTTASDDPVFRSLTIGLR